MAMTIKEFTDYINDHATIDEVVVEKEIELWQQAKFGGVELTQKLAEEIVQSWNSQEEDNFEDSYEILGIIELLEEMRFFDQYYDHLWPT